MASDMNSDGPRCPALLPKRKCVVEDLMASDNSDGDFGACRRSRNLPKNVVHACDGLDPD
jgi:hypothetical protein